MASTYVALLRGINVGGKNKLPMKELVELFGEAGCVQVRHYIQSGNVIFSATPALAAKVPKVIAAQITKRFGFSAPVQVRSETELRQVIGQNPFSQQGIAEDALHVMFLADKPNSASVEKLDPDRSPPDQFLVQGQEIYLYLPEGVADTKLTNAYFDAKLSTVSTGRNWKTVKKLLELMQD
jgi:uncharacterized protein (DUF1697 family)